MTIISKAIYPTPTSRRCIKVFAPFVSYNAGEKKHASSVDKITFVLPTYNERENLECLIPELEKTLDGLDVEGSIIVVDDNSRDGTGDLAVEFARRYKNIIVIKRPGKMGLGSAYQVGFKHAIDSGADIIFEMDSDLSHRPEYIPTFLKCFKMTGAGLVIGSRYCKGGGTVGWPFTRKFVSGSANFIARLLLGLGNVHDTTSGYRAFKADTLKKIGYENIHSNGYSFQGELLYKTTFQKIQVREIPFIFYEREHGTSKLGTNEIKEFLLFVARYFLQRIFGYVGLK